MTKFNLKEHIAKNKATFFGSLTEGQFSWMTQDTGQQIGSEEENMIPVYMFDDKGKYYYEPNYDGYGVFGGMDYYELLDQMNGGSGDRSRGIDLAFNKEETSTPILFPALITRPSEFDYTTHDFTQEAKHDPNQSWYAAEEDEDFIDQNDEEVYGYDDDEEELEEGYMGQFYAPEYLEQKYGKEMADKITAEIEEMDENSYDRFTEFTTAKEVEDYISDIKDMLNLNEVKTTNTKMKKSELTAKIREMVLAEANAPINMVTTMDGKTVVGTHQYGVGFKSNEAGQKMGFKDNPTSIPNGTKMSSSKEDMNEDTYAPTPETDFLAELEGMLDDKNGLTDLQQYVYDFESKVSDERDEEEEQEFLDAIKQLKTPQDVYDYYAYDRGWEGSDLDNIFKQVKTKFKNLITTDDLTPFQRARYSYTKERFGNDEARKSLDIIKTFNTQEEFNAWRDKKIKDENDLNKAKRAKEGTTLKEVKDDENGLTPLQKYVYNYEKDISGEDEAQQFLDDIKKLNTPDDVYDYYAYDRDWEGSMDDDLDNIFRQVSKKFKNVSEAKKDKETNTEEVTDDVTDGEETVDVTDDFSMEEPQGPGKIDVTQNANADLTGTKKDVQDNLEAALEAARALGDEKLATQVGNTITFFNKQHVVKDTTVAENIKEILLLQKRAGIITETQYKQKLNEISEDEDEVPLTSKVKSFINKAIADSKKDGEFEELKKADWFENELIDELIDLFPNKDYDSASSEVIDYIKDKIK
jgi:hypothetical protein